MGAYEVNEQFNIELANFDTLTELHTFNLGKPSPILQACGFDGAFEIRLTKGKVRQKTNKHCYSKAILRDLPLRLQDPLIVSGYLKTSGTLNVVIETFHFNVKESEWQPLLVGVELKQDIQVRGKEQWHVVRSIFPKNLESLRWWIEASTCADSKRIKAAYQPIIYINKKGIPNLLPSHGTIRHVVEKTRNSTTKIVKDFDNPIGEAEVLAFRQSLHEAERVWLAEGRQAFYDKQGINGVNAMEMNKQSSSAEKNSSANNDLREMKLFISQHNDWIPYFKIMREKGFLDNEDVIRYSKSFDPIRAYINRERPKRSYICILSSDREKWNAGIKYLEVFDQIYKKTFTKRAEKLKIEIKKRGRDVKNLTEYLINRTKEKE